MALSLRVTSVAWGGSWGAPSQSGQAPFSARCLPSQDPQVATAPQHLTAGAPARVAC